MYLCKKEKFKPPGKLKKSLSSNNLKVDEIGRFQKAYASGFNNGVNFIQVIKEINNSAIKKKHSHYIWYIFPQPVYKPKSGIFKPSPTSKFFYITDKETRMFLEDVNLSTQLLRVLNALVNKNFSPAELHKYFSKNEDHKKFKSFRTHFKKIIRVMKPQETDSQGRKIIEISEKLGDLEIV
jgi:hypothetical protein